MEASINICSVYSYTPGGEADPTGSISLPRRPEGKHPAILVKRFDCKLLPDLLLPRFTFIHPSNESALVYEYLSVILIMGHDLLCKIPQLTSR
jgi:hypothetical protein